MPEAPELPADGKFRMLDKLASCSRPPACDDPDERCPKLQNFPPTGSFECSTNLRHDEPFDGAHHRRDLEIAGRRGGLKQLLRMQGGHRTNAFSNAFSKCDP